MDYYQRKAIVRMQIKKRLSIIEQQGGVLDIDDIINEYADNRAYAIGSKAIIDKIKEIVNKSPVLIIRSGLVERNTIKVTNDNG